MIFDYSPIGTPFDARCGGSMHILRTLYIRARLYIESGIG
jgi:hypothetical protein